MQSQIEIDKINRFLTVVTPSIVKSLKASLESAGLQVTEQLLGNDPALSIKKGKLEIKFFLMNLLLEIATVDRDEEPMRFDDRLRDFKYYTNKMLSTVHGKLKILSAVLSQDDLSKIAQDLDKFAHEFERIRVITIDPDKIKKND